VNYLVTVAGQAFEIEVDHERLVRINGRPLYPDLEQEEGLPVYALALDDAGYVVFVEEAQGHYRVEVQGRIYEVDVERQVPRLAPRQAECSGDAGDCLAVTAPLAGNLSALLVAAGDPVEAGQAVAVVESMKMQMQLKASRSGIVEAVHGPAGRNVDKGEKLVTLRLTPQAPQGAAA
jgi:biotin carboxyl carrier protein